MSIKILTERQHSKASEKYLDVIFSFDDGTKWKGSVPIHYRRTGIEANTPEEKKKVIDEAYKAMHPSKEKDWLSEQEKFWSSHNKKVTMEFFEGLKDCKWKCVGCQLPKNPNWARRIQDIKEFGYTLATDTNKYCQTCGGNKTHLIMLRIPRGGSGGLGYETWSPNLRKRILKVLNHYDAYENRSTSSYAILPDHKFPEIRWDDKVREENPDDIGDEEIIKKFQLLSNQRNQQKREVCRNCFQTGLRGTPYGIAYFYEGDAIWQKNIPKIGKEAEEGCKGCGWYDLEAWRKSLNNSIKN